MKNRVIQTKKPEENELDRKKAELESFKLELVQKEMELTNLKTELHMFELQYLKIVGVRIAKLDDINAQIAEFFGLIHTEDESASIEAKNSRAKANESAKYLNEYYQNAIQTFTPSENLKTLYRETAKKIHPDFAVDENDRIRRTELMATINELYKNGDEEKLAKVLQEWDASPESVIGDDIGAQLIRTIRQIAAIQNHLLDLEVEIKILIESSIYHLRSELENLNKDITIVLEEMAESIDEQICDQQNQLEKIIQFYKMDIGKSDK